MEMRADLYGPVTGVIHAQLVVRFPRSFPRRSIEEVFTGNHGNVHVGSGYWLMDGDQFGAIRKSRFDLDFLDHFPDCPP